MSKEKLSIRNMIIISALLLILLVGFSLLGSTIGMPLVVVSGQNSVWDLRGVDFETHNAYLTGEVLHIPDALLTPEEFNSRESEAVEQERVTHLDFHTSRIRILMPDDGWYTFSRISVDFSHRIFVNGEWLMDIGNPGDSPETSIPDTGRITFTAKAVNGIIEIIQQSSNFVHRESGEHIHWYVGTGRTLESEFRADDYRTNLIMGCFLVLFLIFTLLFFVFRKNRALLYFALFCLVWFMRAGVTHGKAFTFLLPWMDWYTKFRIEYIAIPAVAMLTLAIIDTLFPGILHKIVLRVLYVFSALYILLFLFADTLLMSYALLGVYAVYGATILYITACFVIRLRNINTGQGFFLLGMVLFFLSGIFDAAGYLNYINIMSIDVTNITILMFALCEATAVFLSTMDEVETAKLREREAVANNTALRKLSRMKTEFLQDIKHEVRNPLHVISMRTDYINLCIDTGKRTEDARKALQIIQDEAIRLGRMINGMVELATTEGMETSRKKVDFEAMLNHSAETARLLAEQNGNTLSIEIAPDLPYVHAEAGQLSRVPANLLENANNNTRGGEIIIKASAFDNYITVTIKDTGDGIDPKLLPRIFERGVSGEGGKGYGLSISKTIIEAHGGTIKAESGEWKPGSDGHGCGTVVTFTIPVYGGQDELRGDA